MKLLLMALLTLQLNAGDFIQEDKKLHGVVTLVIWGGCTIFGEILKKQGVTDKINLNTCLIPATAITIGKEVWDHYHPETHTADYNDFTAGMTPMLTVYGSFKWAGF